jgi:hypothetical protein
VSEWVQEVNLGVRWDPNASQAVLLADDLGRTALALNPHFDDRDQRCVVIVWAATRLALLGDPNDESISGHPLYGSGLEHVTWAGEVEQRQRLRDLERINNAHPHHDGAQFERLRHHVIPLKEAVAEVVAGSIGVRRIGGATLDAAAEALRSGVAAGEIPNTQDVRPLIRRLLDLAAFPGREQLLSQVERVEYVDGPLTMMDLRVVGECSPAIGVPSPAPSNPTVFDQHGEPIGELLLWLDGEGYINCLEFAWWTDEMPTVLPTPERVRNV